MYMSSALGGGTEPRDAGQLTSIAEVERPAVPAMAPPGQLLDDPVDREVANRVARSAERLAANLAALVGGKPRLS